VPRGSAASREPVKSERVRVYHEILVVTTHTFCRTPCRHPCSTRRMPQKPRHVAGTGDCRGSAARGCGRLAGKSSRCKWSAGNRARVRMVCPRRTLTTSCSPRRTLTTSRQRRSAAPGLSPGRGAPTQSSHTRNTRHFKHNVTQVISVIRNFWAWTAQATALTVSNQMHPGA
jgi:hypothetical protein